MSKNYQIAGQAAPAADIDTLVYTVPVSSNFVASSILVCNRSISGSPASFRVAVVPSGETLADKHYVAYERLIDIRGTVTVSLNIGLDESSKVYVRASSANLSFTLGGVVITK